MPDDGSCWLSIDTPASYPSSQTASSVSPRWNPRPYRFDSSGQSLRGRTISATRAGGTIRPANSASQNALRSAAVV